ncbi:hypothetical protein ACQPW1_13180 [Nocardia sp. CA-128927]|uniref:hypothetical protein n=1 Tax=Nocardia sp. CA-128927 TaxID=3239975 RepID=UPI003D95E501
MKHATTRFLIAGTIAATVAMTAPATATAELPTATAAQIDLLDSGSAEAARGAFASIVFFGAIGLCLLRLLPADQCHFI